MTRHGFLLAIAILLATVIPSSAQPAPTREETAYLQSAAAEMASFARISEHIAGVLQMDGPDGVWQLRDDFIMMIEINSSVQSLTPPPRYIDAHALMSSTYGGMAAGAADIVYGIDNEDSEAVRSGFGQLANAAGGMPGVVDALQAARNAPRALINAAASTSVPRGYLATASTDIRFTNTAFRWVPKGQTETIPVRLVVCEYPALSINCSEAREASQTIQVTILDITRSADAIARGTLNDSQWERIRPDPGEEAVLVHLQVTYVSGRPGTTFEAGEAIDVLNPSLAANGSYGRRGPSLLGRQNSLSELRNALRIGSTADGWTVIYTTAGQDFAVMVAEHPNTRVLLAAQ